MKPSEFAFLMHGKYPAVFLKNRKCRSSEVTRPTIIRIKLAKINTESLM